jgi:hypothetical protein
MTIRGALAVVSVAALVIAHEAARSGAAVDAGAAPVSFELTFHGSRVRDPDAGSPFGLANQGTFTASPPLCPAGRARDVKQEWTRTVARALRRFTCDDGSGSVTAQIEDIRAELGGPGNWKIVAGTGDYVRLRGRGAFEGRHTGGDEPETFTFVASWEGIVDFDDVAPVVAISQATARKLTRPRGVYLVRVTFSARDDLETNAVSYDARARAGASESAPRRGAARPGSVSVALRLRPPRGTRKVRIVITASDPVGNERSVTRSVNVR